MGAALIVAPDGATTERLAELLKERGYVPTNLTEGKSAHHWVRQHRPDLVFLDLELPDLDSSKVCEMFKLDQETNLIPLILLTPRGEQNHRDSRFEVGANQYLPKPFTAQQLDQAVHESNVWRDSLLKNGAFGEIHFHLQSDLGYLDEFNKLLSSLFLQSGLNEVEAKQLTMAVRELGANAIEWGHKRQVDRIVAVTYRVERDKVTVVIRDTGPGFNPEQVPHAARSDDPVSHMEVREALGLREGGFGIMIVKGLVDELCYNECGNEVRLVKYVSARKAGPSEKRA
jgi:CheY-like chemotaxis protein